MTRSSLSPAMRQAIALADPDFGLRGAVHGSTLHALERHGLVDREGYLTAAGEELRDRLRLRVDEELAEHGYRPTGVGLLYTDPDERGSSVTRGGAMRRTGVTW